MKYPNINLSIMRICVSFFIILAASKVVNAGKIYGLGNNRQVSSSGALSDVSFMKSDYSGFGLRLLWSGSDT